MKNLPQKLVLRLSYAAEGVIKVISHAGTQIARPEILSEWVQSQTWNFGPKEVLEIQIRVAPQRPIRKVGRPSLETTQVLLRELDGGPVKAVEFARRAAVSQSTVRRTLRSLRKQGLVVAVQRVGWMLKPGSGSKIKKAGP